MCRVYRDQLLGKFSLVPFGRDRIYGVTFNTFQAFFTVSGTALTLQNIYLIYLNFFSLLLSTIEAELKHFICIFFRFIQRR